MAYDDETFQILESVEDAELITDKEIESTLEWFTDKRGVPADEFFDRLFSRSGPKNPTTGDTLDLTQMDNPAAKNLLKRARKMKREMDDYNLS